MNKDIESLNRVFFEFICACGERTTINHAEYEDYTEEQRKTRLTPAQISDIFMGKCDLDGNHRHDGHSEYYDRCKKLVEELNDIVSDTVLPIEKLFQYFGIVVIGNKTKRYVCQDCNTKYLEELKKLEGDKQDYIEKLAATISGGKG